MAFFKNSITFEESVERFAHYMVNELEAIQKKEDKIYEGIITEKMEEIEKYWSQELDEEEDESDQIKKTDPAFDSQFQKPEMPIVNNGRNLLRRWRVHHNQTL